MLFRSVQSFRRADAGAPWEAASALAVRTVAEWLAGHEPGAWVGGPGVDAHAGRLPAGLRLLEPGLRLPQPAGLLRAGLRKYRAGARDDVWAAEPIYLRPSAAEEQWRRLGRP